MLWCELFVRDEMDQYYEEKEERKQKRLAIILGETDDDDDDDDAVLDVGDGQDTNNERGKATLAGQAASDVGASGQAPNTALSTDELTRRIQKLEVRLAKQEQRRKDAQRRMDQNGTRNRWEDSLRLSNFNQEELKKNPLSLSSDSDPDSSSPFRKTVFVVLQKVEGIMTKTYDSLREITTEGQSKPQIEGGIPSTTATISTTTTTATTTASTQAPEATGSDSTSLGIPSTLSPNDVLVKDVQSGWSSELSDPTEQNAVQEAAKDDDEQTTPSESGGIGAAWQAVVGLFRSGPSSENDGKQNKKQKQSNDAASKH